MNTSLMEETDLIEATEVHAEASELSQVKLLEHRVSTL